MGVERELWIFENRLLRKEFRPKMQQLTGDLRKLRGEELHVLYFSSNIRVTK
jgi:hypothetical protein